MTRSHRRRLAVLSAGAALVVPAALLAGCSAGQLAATSREVSAVPGGSADVSVPPPPGQKDAPDQRISVRNATVDYTTGGAYQPGQVAPLTMWVINGTGAPVTLTGVKSIGNGQVRNCEPVTPPSVTPPAAVASAEASGAAVPSGSATPAGTPSSPASPSAPPSTEPVFSTTINIPVQAGQSIELGQGSKDGCLQLANLTQPVVAGKTVGLVLTFLAQQDGHTYTIGTEQDPFTVPFAPPVTAAPRVSISVASAGPID